MTLLAAQQEQRPICEACKHPIQPGEELKGVGEFWLCADLEACVERKLHPNARAREGRTEPGEDPENGAAE